MPLYLSGAEVQVNIQGKAYTVEYRPSRLIIEDPIIPEEPGVPDNPDIPEEPENLEANLE